MLRTLYPLTAGTYTAIPALRFARLVELEEDATGNQTGIACKFPEDNFTAVDSYIPQQQPVILGQKVGLSHGRGAFVGEPAQTGLHARAADIYAMVTCLSGATVLRVTEED